MSQYPNSFSPPPAPRPPVVSYETPSSQQPQSPGSLRLFRFMGITVFLHSSWFIVALIELYYRNGAYGSLFWNAAEYVSLFAIVLMHEFGHALACRSVGGKADKITLWPLGGIAYVSPPPRPGAVLWSIAAGPLVNVILLPITFFAYWKVSLSMRSDLDFFLRALFRINAGLLIFNVLPIFPLDGGQILQSILWFFMSRGRSLMIAAWIGMVGAACLVLMGLDEALHGGSYWTILIALYVGSSAWNGVKNAKILLELENPQSRPDAACPHCGAHPPIGNHWKCPCGNSFDTFLTGGTCPQCGINFNVTQCGHCGQQSLLQQWLPARSGAYAPTQF